MDILGLLPPLAIYAFPLVALGVGAATAVLWQQNRRWGVAVGIAAVLLAASPLYFLFSFLSRPMEDMGQSNEVFDVDQPQISLDSLVVATHADFQTSLEAAKRGDVAAQARVAEDYAQGIEGAPRSPELAATWYREAASHGDARSAYFLSGLYDQGYGVKRDGGQALHWLRFAADKGYVLAQAELGFKYGTGQGVLQSFEQAAQWCERAARQDDRSSQYYMGRMYELGKGVHQDDTAALRWYLQARLGGHKQAEQAIAREQSHLPRENVARAYQAVADYLAGRAP